MTNPAPDSEQPDESIPPPPVAAGSDFGEVVQYESDEAHDHWDDRIWRR